MITLLNQYKNARKELRYMLAELSSKEKELMDMLITKKDQERAKLKNELEIIKKDKGYINSMINSTSKIIEWLETGVNPYFQKGIDVNGAYHIKYLSNMDILPDLTERFRTEREELDVSDEQIKIVQRAIMNLSERERDCLILHIGQGMSMSEVSEQLGISKASVQTYIKRAREKIEEVVK